MSVEIMKPTAELWFDGPNYTADAVIIAEAEQKLLLIKRKDGGGWALPGGFLNNGESSLAAAIREANEEAGIVVADGHFVYGGIVDDPRNSERAWIETDAYLFPLPFAAEVRASDDAEDTAWFPLDNLPSLYASHQAIINRALDITQSVQRCRQVPVGYTRSTVEGGHMNYTKSMVVAPEAAVFVKSYEGPETDQLHVAALEKEAAMMAHLRTAGFPHLPAFSHRTGQDLFMEALPPEHGWQWRAEANSVDAYVRDCLAAFSVLEYMPIPPDSTQIPSALAIYWEEGWQALDDERQSEIHELYDRMQPLLRPESQATAKRLQADLPQLRQAAQASLLPASYVFCHHDARQANIAWHPDHGARLVDWSWADIGRPGSDATMLLIDLHKHGHDISPYYASINSDHCVALMGFWLEHALRPVGERDPTIRLQQYVSALAAYEVLEACGSGV